MPLSSTDSVNPIAYAGNAIAKVLLVIGLVVGINEASSIAPALNTVSRHWLSATEFVWRQPSDLLGQPFFSETAAVMTCYTALMAIAISALWLEDTRTPIARPISKTQRAKLQNDWHARWVQSIIPGSIATVVLVATVEYVAFKGWPDAFFASLPMWYWAMHGLAILIVPLVICQFGFRRLFDLTAIGLLCGVLFIAIALPSAVEAATKGIDAQNFYRELFLKYAIVRLPFSLALILGIPSARFLLAQLLAICGAGSLILFICWLAPASA